VQAAALLTTPQYLQVSDTPVTDPNDPNVMGVRVGVPVTFTVNAVSLDETGTLDILVVEDPGSPIGLSSQPTSTQCAAGVTACRTVTYTPRKVHAPVLRAGMCWGRCLGLGILVQSCQVSGWPHLPAQLVLHLALLPFFCFALPRCIFLLFLLLLLFSPTSPEGTKNCACPA